VSAARLPNVALISGLLAVVACSPQPPDEGDYVTRLESTRAEKDKHLESASDSPIPKHRKADFLPLPYYPIDPAYNVPGGLTPSNDPTVVHMPTSTGVPERYRRAGTLNFTLGGQELKLTAFVQADARDLNSLFVPFRDLTAGTTTYPGGRYLDLVRTGTDYYEVDFNRAYNPYCYYNPTWVCPLPPPENHLKVEIPAGEKIHGPKS
jgi:uncharacterized protein (DUF1684 family)